MKDYRMVQSRAWRSQAPEIPGDHGALQSELGVGALAEKLAAAMPDTRVRTADTDSLAAAAL